MLGQFLLYSKGIRLFMCVFSTSFPVPVYCRILNVGAVQQGRVGYLLGAQWSIHADPKLIIYPSATPFPFGNPKFVCCVRESLSVLEISACLLYFRFYTQVIPPDVCFYPTCFTDCGHFQFHPYCLNGIISVFLLLHCVCVCICVCTCLYTFTSAQRLSVSY